LQLPRNEIKSSGGHLLGYTREDGNGRVVAYGPGGQRLGYYDPNTNTTRSMGGSILSRGDTLAALVLERE
jgi:hypothetical protein